MIKGIKRICYIKSIPFICFYYRIEFKESAPIIEFLRSQVAKEIYNGAYKIL